MKLKIGDGLNLPIEIASQAVALVGIRGSGKTNTAGVIAEELLDRGQQIVVIDPTDAWWGLRSDYPVFIFGGPHGDLDLAETDGKTLAEFVVQEQVPIILSLRHLRKGAQRRLITEFCEELYHLKGKPEHRTPLTVFIDEAPQFVPQRVMGEMARLVGAVQDMILLGRNAGFGVVLISQRFATLNADVRTQADTVIVHRLPSPLDRKALSEWIEENASIAEQKEVLSSLAKLQTGEAWIWAPYFELFKRSQVRPRRTFDSSAAPKVGQTLRPPKDLTKVDLEKLKGKLSAAIEKAKADDPRELRKQIAELKKQLGTATTQVVSNTAAPVSPKVVEKFVLKDGQLARAEKLVSTLAQSFETNYERLTKSLSEFRQEFGPIAREIATAIAATTNTQPTMTQRVMDRPTPVSSPGHRAVPAATASRPVPRVSPSSNGDLGKAERAILTTLAQHPDGCERGKLALLSGYSWTGTFRTYLSALRTAGYIVGDNGAVMSITDAGRAALGHYEPLPSGRQLADYWLNNQRFNSTEREILQALLSHPNGLTADQLCEAIGKEWTGTLRTYLSNLRTAGVVVGKNSEVMRASEELFD